MHGAPFVRWLMPDSRRRARTTPARAVREQNPATANDTCEIVAKTLSASSVVDTGDVKSRVQSEPSCEAALEEGNHQNFPGPFRSRHHVMTDNGRFHGDNER